MASVQPPRSREGERALLALVVLAGVIAVALFATVTPKGRAPDEYRYYGDISQLAREGAVGTATGHPPLYSAVSWLPFRVGRNPAQKYYLIRLMGMLFMAGAVYATYKTSSELFGEGTLARWAPPLLVALLPQFAFVSGSVNSDALLAMLSAVFFYLCVRAIRRSAEPAVILSLAVVCVLGVLSKQRFLVLLPLLLPVLAVAAHRRFHAGGGAWVRRGVVAGSVLAGAAVVLGLVRLVSRIAPAGFPALPTLASATSVLGFTSRDFWVDLFAMSWGYFDWLALPMHTPVYLVFLALTALSSVGVAIAGVRRVKRLGPVRAVGDWRAAVWLVLAFGVLLTVYSVVQYHVAGLGAQGRYLFVALVPFAVFFGRGLAEVVPVRHWPWAFRALTLLLVGTIFIETVFVLIPYYY
jgi:4-amino-4-deoxy-L-arabinose transferase-like glycosyltransferase